jgi:hypothetical protein
VPDESAGKTYEPLRLAVTVCVKCVVGLVTVTVAPGMTFPEGSNTVPAIWPLLLTCALAVPAHNPAARINAIPNAIEKCRKSTFVILPPGESGQTGKENTGRVTPKIDIDEKLLQASDTPPNGASLWIQYNMSRDILFGYRSPLDNAQSR